MRIGGLVCDVPANEGVFGRDSRKRYSLCPTSGLESPCVTVFKSIFGGVWDRGQIYSLAELRRRSIALRVSYQIQVDSWVTQRCMPIYSALWPMYGKPSRWQTQSLANSVAGEVDIFWFDREDQTIYLLCCKSISLETLWSCSR